MRELFAIFKREFAAYFATPLAFVFIVIFLFAMGAFTFYIGHFFENDTADLGGLTGVLTNQSYQPQKGTKST